MECWGITVCCVIIGEWMCSSVSEQDAWEGALRGLGESGNGSQFVGNHHVVTGEGSVDYESGGGVRGSRRD